MAAADLLPLSRLVHDNIDSAADSHLDTASYFLERRKGLQLEWGSYSSLQEVAYGPNSRRSRMERCVLEHLEELDHSTG
jgi:hypothetical protein